MVIKWIALKQVSSPCKRIILCVAAVLFHVSLVLQWHFSGSDISCVIPRQVFKNPHFCRTGECAATFFWHVLSRVVDIILTKQLSSVLCGSLGYLYRVCHFIVSLLWTRTWPLSDWSVMMSPLFCGLPHITMCLGRSSHKNHTSHH